MAKVIWTSSAKKDVQEILAFIALEQPESARLFLRKVMKCVYSLGQFSHLGKRIRNELLEKKDYREYIVPPCRVVYLVKKNEIVILAIVRTEKIVDLVEVATRTAYS